MTTLHHDGAHRRTEPASERHTARVRAGRLAARVLMSTLLVAVVGAIAVTVVLPRATHGAALSVLSGSMSPGIPVGSVVVVRPVDPASLEVGDVVTYQAGQGEDSLVTHRIVDVDATSTPTTFTFKGDANRGPDLDPVSADQIRGEVWFDVPYLGAVRDALHGEGGITLVAILLLAGYSLSQLGAGFRERRRGTPSATEDHDITVGQPLVVAELDPARLRELGPGTPREFVARWSGLVLEESDDVVRVLLAPAPADLDLSLGALQLMDARRVLVTSAGTPMRVTAVLQPSLDHEKEHHALA